MSLHERYNAHNEKSGKQRMVIAVVCLLAVSFFFFCYSFARYAADWNGGLNTAIAQWKIKVNGVALTASSEAGGFPVELIPYPDTDIIPEHPDKIKAGQKGYFDIVIDPTGTEVSFSYSVSVDTEKSRLPSSMTIDGCTVTVGERVVKQAEFKDGAKPIVDDDAILPDGGIFAEKNSVTVRFDWTWADSVADDDFDEFGDYGIAVSVSVLQYIGDETNAPVADGVRAL